MLFENYINQLVWTGYWKVTIPHPQTFYMLKYINTGFANVF